MSHISPFSFKNHNKIAFCLLRLLWGRFLTDLISLQNKYFQTLGSSLSTTLRIVELFLVQIVGLDRANIHIMEYDLKFKRYLVMVGFCVRQSKIRLILIRLLGGLLWSFDPFKMGIFWILAKFWISRVIFGKIYVKKKWKKWC